MENIEISIGVVACTVYLVSWSMSSHLTQQKFTRNICIQLIDEIDDNFLIKFFISGLKEEEEKKTHTSNNNSKNSKSGAV